MGRAGVGTAIIARSEGLYEEKFVDPITREVENRRIVSAGGAEAIFAAACGVGMLTAGGTTRIDCDAWRVCGFTKGNCSDREEASISGWDSWSTPEVAADLSPAYRCRRARTINIPRNVVIRMTCLRITSVEKGRWAYHEKE